MRVASGESNDKSESGESNDKSEKQQRSWATRTAINKNAMRK